jgi:hypothetical protein
LRPAGAVGFDAPHLAAATREDDGCIGDAGSIQRGSRVNGGALKIGRFQSTSSRAAPRMIAGGSENGFGFRSGTGNGMVLGHSPLTATLSASAAGRRKIVRRVQSRMRTLGPRFMANGCSLQFGRLAGRAGGRNVAGGRKAADAAGEVALLPPGDGGVSKVEHRRRRSRFMADASFIGTAGGELSEIAPWAETRRPLFRPGGKLRRIGGLPSNQMISSIGQSVSRPHRSR